MIQVEKAIEISCNSFQPWKLFDKASKPLAKMIEIKRHWTIIVALEMEICREVQVLTLRTIIT